ncbi:unnamed protein product [Albugo candida]|uniref:Uncharacterized protein n=1 Tax=Albugo candida TaxID=65357 RepID=A0A024G523_9STRA|nr:unnamed protein product [Albugo candida]|eukprot:CCI41782.1 unnamed protein product [Albugo candida]
MKLLKQLIDEFLISLCLYLYFFNCFSNTLPECHTLLLRKDAMLLILRQLRDLSGVRATKGVHENNVHGIGITMLTHIQQKKNIYSLHSITKRASCHDRMVERRNNRKLSRRHDLDPLMRPRKVVCPEEEKSTLSKHRSSFPINFLFSIS